MEESNEQTRTATQGQWWRLPARRLAILAGLVSRSERRNTTRVGGHDRSAGSRALSPRPFGGARRRSPLDRSKQQTTHIQSVGRLVPRATLEAAVSERGQSPAEPQ